MSKAFTREDDDAPEELPPPRASAALPPGARNYLTSDGADRLRDEMQRLEKEHAELVAQGTEETKRQARLREQSRQGIEEVLASAEVVKAGGCEPDEVCFGSTVRVREPDGSEWEYRIVGVDEIDLDRGWVSWLSPIARALMKAKLGQKVRFQAPSGEKTLEVVGIR